ncbi:zinc finger BED domain-containing protein 5-like [Acyrthosiphon pisum]|uniref:DUF4371 domain-containing protein n=1 Tax=Acyrthosiphon pisum TaxID=7029 RepID=A0A8R2B7M9_ACYPI|nr:zinc finger BED domain-containing protein 5-like [Acyrthosiphon pisum]|eukprot:XP_008185178.1 PREDICTED: zinc finger BED domain-containing protein 5-like [Acyrthosiphon pisum]
MFGKEAAEQISNIQLSNDTVRRRIITMSEDIVKNVNEILQKDKEFALQLDESTDVSGKSQLISFIRFVNEEKIIEQFLLCRELQTTTTGVDIFNAVDNYFEENNMVWSNCISICTDGAAAMTGRFKGFLTLTKNKKPNLITIHCFLHREALMVKISDGGELSDVLKTVIEMINYIKKRPVKCRIFEELCKNIGMSKSEASKTFRVPRITLRNKIEGKSPTESIGHGGASSMVVIQKLHNLMNQ